MYGLGECARLGGGVWGHVPSQRIEILSALRVGGVSSIEVYFHCYR